MKWNFLYQITAASRTPDKGVPLPDPRSLCYLSPTEFFEPPPPEQNSWVRHCLPPSLHPPLPPFLVISTWPSYLLDLNTRIIFGENYRSWILHYVIPSSPLLLRSSYGSNMFLSTLFADVFSLYSSLNVRDQISHHTKQKAMLQSCRFWSLYFWIANWKTKGSAPRMRANIPRVQSAPSSFMNELFTFCDCSQTFELRHSFKNVLPLSMLWRSPVFCLPVMNIYWIFSTFVTRPVSFLVSKKGDNFFSS